MEAPVKKSEAFGAEHAKGSGEKRKAAAGSQCPGRSWADQTEEDSGSEWEQPDYGTPETDPATGQEERRLKPSRTPVQHPSLVKLEKEICEISKEIDEATRRHEGREDINELMMKRDTKIAELTLFEDMPNPVTITELDPPPPLPKASRSWSRSGNSSASAGMDSFAKMAERRMDIFSEMAS